MTMVDPQAIAQRIASIVQSAHPEWIVSGTGSFSSERDSNCSDRMCSITVKASEIGSVGSVDRGCFVHTGLSESQELKTATEIGQQLEARMRELAGEIPTEVAQFCEENGYTEPFFQEGCWWGFAPNAVMPVQLEQKSVWGRSPIEDLYPAWVERRNSTSEQSQMTELGGGSYHMRSEYMGRAVNCTVTTDGRSPAEVEFDRRFLELPNGYLQERSGGLHRFIEPPSDSERSPIREFVRNPSALPSDALIDERSPANRYIAGGFRPLTVPPSIQCRVFGLNDCELPPWLTLPSQNTYPDGM